MEEPKQVADIEHERKDVVVVMVDTFAVVDAVVVLQGVERLIPESWSDVSAFAASHSVDTAFGGVPLPWLLPY